MAKDITNLFFELIQVSIGTKAGFDEVPSREEWARLFDLANKQSLSSVLIEGINKVPSLSHSIDKALLLEWIGLNQLTVSRNKLQNRRSGELCMLFNVGGFRSTILKGQGTALYYEHPEYRQSGDIDIWVEGDRDEIIGFLRKKGFGIGHVDIKHSDVEIFEDVPVEVHFQPSWMYSPLSNGKLLSFFNSKSEAQFENADEKAGFIHTTIDFDLVYSMVHVYRHIFSEGIGLRQLVDYYYILQNSSSTHRKETFEILKGLKMKSFVAGIMWILTSSFGMKEEYVLCPVNERHGMFLLSEIMTAGNFGQYDERTNRVSKDKKFKRGFVQLGRNLRFFSYYPSEVLWSPFWKVWHWGWRKKKKYL